MNIKTTVLLTSAITAIMITGVLSSNPAYGQGGPCESVEWFMNINGLNIVAAPSGEILGEGNLKSQFHTVNDNPGADIVTGISEAKFTFRGDTGEADGKVIKLRSDNLAYEANQFTGITTIEGTAMTKNGNIWDVSIIVDNFVVSSNGKKATANIDLTLTSPSGIELRQQILGFLVLVDIKGESKE